MGKQVYPRALPISLHRTKLNALSFSDYFDTKLAGSFAVTEYDQQAEAWTTTYSSPSNFLTKRQGLSRFHKLHYADGPLKGSYVVEGRIEAHFAQVQPDAPFETKRDCQQHAKRPRRSAEEDCEAEHPAQAPQAFDACIVPPTDCYSGTCDTPETIVNGNNRVPAGSGAEAAVDDSYHQPTVTSSSNTTSSVGTSSSPVAQSAYPQQEDTLLALDAVMSGEYLMEKLQQSEDIVWAACGRLPRQQGVSDNNAVQNAGHARSHETEIAGRTTEKNARLISQEAETIREQALQERWERTLQNIRILEGTAAWNVALVLFVVEYAFSTYASNMEQQVLAEAAAEFSVNHTNPNSSTYPKISDEMSHGIPVCTLTGLLVTTICF